MADQRKVVALVTVLAAAAGGVLLGLRGCRPAVRAAPAAVAGRLPGVHRTGSEELAPRGKLVPGGRPLDAESERAVRALASAHLEARARGDAALLRGQLAMHDIFSDLASMDPRFDPAVRPAGYHPLDPTPENLQQLEDNIVTDLLRETVAEREDFARKATVSHVIPLADGRVFLRLHGDAVLTTVESAGREVSDLNPTAKAMLLPQDRSMLVARQPDGSWKIAGFPQRDRHPVD